MVDIITEKFRVQTLHDASAQDARRFANWAGTSNQAEVSPTFKLSSGRHSWDHCLFETGTTSPHAGNFGAFSAFRQTKTPQRSLETPTFSKHRKKYTGSLEICPHCDSAPNTPVPPKKRQCRSLSIPSSSTWCNHGNLLKPIALRPHMNNNKLMKNRNSPLCLRNSHSNVISPGSGLRSSSEISSPRESPVPRPASVSSGFYDSSNNSLNAPWLDHLTSFQPSRFNFSQNRSLSMEETISFSTNVSCGSMPVIPGSKGNVMPSSPRRQRIMRSRSQPCVLSDRKCGIKRRREEDRPTLDFQKMKETAYQRRPRSVTFSQPLHIRSSSRSLSNLFSDQEDKIFGLKPITGSPLDSSIPSAVVKSPTTSPTKEVNEEMEEVEVTNASQSDSGCSDLCDPPEILNFTTVTEDLDCNCHGDGAEGLFHIDIGNEIDLEQIEND